MTKSPPLVGLAHEVNTSVTRHALSNSATSIDATSEAVNAYIDDVVAGGDSADPDMPNISAEEWLAISEDEEAMEELEAGMLHFALRAQSSLSRSDQQFHSIP